MIFAANAPMLAVVLAILSTSTPQADPLDNSDRELCQRINAEHGWTEKHPSDAGTAVILCRWDPTPGWSEALWVRTPDMAYRVPLHGTGVIRFDWLNCAGEPAARIVDITHQGERTVSLVYTNTRRIMRLPLEHPTPPGCRPAS